MGGEFAQDREWHHDYSLDWHLTHDPLHAGMQNLVRDLNLIYRGTAALHERDCEPEGFSWIDCSDADNSVISYVRYGTNSAHFVVAICNFTPVVRHQYRIGVPRRGLYHESLNTDSSHYGGSNVGNYGAIYTQDIPAHGHPCSLELTLPPLGVLVLHPDPREA
jgi:1,4-alpha-glucan branching enzyme